ncbi:MAG: GNAT family N-acetyltransferase [Candidatus Peribacteria bacterium]|jgi:GNAT superfamily N-acetyltransferase|nr:GNAT family N-acetyltransferase [Candidatus Peribacteria bacterium]
MPNTSPLTIQKFTKQYADVVIKMMENLSDFFSPETIDFAKKKLPKLYGFLAFEQERVWGFIVYECISLHHAKIYRMGVERSHQHQGIGSQLLQYTENALREQQITLLELLTLDEHPDYP